jgi:hypothetical protein
MTAPGLYWPPLDDDAGSGLTDPMTTAGDMIRRSGGNVTERLPAGAEESILMIVDGLPTYVSVVVDDTSVVVDDHSIVWTIP